jgi:ATP-dependent helicase YprA (DUF1998 family)
MNALANSQAEELRKFLEKGYGPGRAPVTFKRYTGQEKGDEREAIRSRPPDILLTNYMMLELLLTRREDRALVAAAQGLTFLVFDELHTYRGRQGADVALLIRRCRLAFGGRDIICVGTSATMASEGTSEDQKREVARVAETMFGTAVDETQVIGETLERATPEQRWDMSHRNATVPGSHPGVQRVCNSFSRRHCLAEGHGLISLGEAFAKHPFIPPMCLKTCGMCGYMLACSNG